MDLNAIDPQAFVIDPSQYPQDRVYRGFTYLWTLIILALGGLCYYFESKVGVALAILMLVAILPLLFFTRMQVDVIETQEGDLVVRRLNPASEVLRLPMTAEIGLSFEKYGSQRNQSRSPEAVWTLNLWDRQGDFPRRTILALRVEQQAKHQLYKDLLRYLQDKGMNVKGFDQTEETSQS